MMKIKNLFWGIILITIGILYLLRSIDIIYFTWSDLFNLWPVILIWCGFLIIPIKEPYKFIINMLVLAAAVVVLLLPSNCCSKCNNNIDTATLTADVQFISDSTTITPSDCQKAELSLSTGAGTYVVSKGDKLADIIAVEKDAPPFKINIDEDSNSSEIVIKQENPVNKIKNKNYHYNLQLNPTPEWDLDISMGAASCDFDFSQFRINELDLSAGASAIKLKLGALSTYCSVDISAGASSITVEIPSSMNCVLYTETALTDKNFNDFKKISKDKYEYKATTETPSGTIDLKIEAGVSDINVLVY